jgi:hypothetical protein
MKTKLEVEEKRASKLQDQVKQLNVRIINILCTKRGSSLHPFQMQLAEYKGMQKAEDESSEYYLARIEELTKKLSQAQGKAQEAEAKLMAEIDKVGPRCYSYNLYHFVVTI